jgi:NAD(P)H dehydrogenase (quinone)
MAAQVKQFIDTLGGMWFEGELEGKATGMFVSTGSIHGGQETTILSSLAPLITSAWSSSACATARIRRS